MTAEHPDTDIVTGGHRATQQMIFTVTQLVETVARMRQAAETRRADAARAATAAVRDAQRAEASQRRAVNARDRVAPRATPRGERETATAAAARQRTDRAAYTPAAGLAWRRDAAPVDLLTAWAAATTWAAHDPKAADVMVRTEDEMRGRWPQVLDRYDQLRVEVGFHPTAAMKTALTEAAAAGWDPATNPAAHPRGGRDPQAALTAGAGQATTEPATTEPAAPAAESTQATRPAAVNPAAQALRFIPTAAAALAATPAAPNRADDHRAAPTRVPAPTLHRGR